MKNIFVLPNPVKDKDFSVTKSVAEFLKSKGAEVYLPTLSGIPNISGCHFSEVPTENTELIIVIGGDGSFIDASVYAVEHDIPMLGVNLGKVGYLSEVEPNDIASLEKIFSGDYSIVEKMLLSAKVTRNNVTETYDRFGVNDVVVSHNSYLGIADFTVCGNDGIIKYRADGLVVSTPAGSTAYSLSVGGPVVSHNADAMIVTPIAPHSFFNRSIIFNGNDEITIKNTGTEKLNVSIDGRWYACMEPGDVCCVSASNKKIKVLTFKKNNMFTALFNKMQIMEEII